MTLGEQLREARERAGLSARALAARCAEVHGGDAEAWRVQIGRYERGVTSPSGRTAEQVAEAMGLAWSLVKEA